MCCKSVICDELKSSSNCEFFRSLDGKIRCRLNEKKAAARSNDKKPVHLSQIQQLKSNNNKKFVIV